MKATRIAAVAASGVLVGRAAAQDSTPAGPTHPGTVSACNKWYLVPDGGTSTDLTVKFGITPAQFRAWNPAASNDDWTDLRDGYSYCVGVSEPHLVPRASSSKKSVPTLTSPPGPTMTGEPANCNNWYLAKKNDDCSTVEAAYGITHAQFLKWNPAVSSDCTTNFWAGEAYCVGVGNIVSKPTTTTATKTTSTKSSSSSSSKSSSKSSTSTKSSTTSTTSTSVVTSTTPYSTRYPVTKWNISTPTVETAWPPTQTQAGQPSYCNYWHLVQGGDTCVSIAAMYSTWMSLADFFAWNPVVGTDCSGLYIMYWVCVGIQPQTSLTLEYPTTSPTIPDEVPWTPTPQPSVDFSFTPSPTQGPLPTNCANYYFSRPGDTCHNVAANLGYVSEEQFLAYNSFLDGNCNGLWSGVYYCVSEWNGTQKDLPLPRTVTTKPSPVPDDTIATCTSWYQTSGDDDCDVIPAIFGTFSKSSFLSWNPSVGQGCTGLVEGTYYCVSVPGTPTTRTAIVTPTPTPTAPVQPGIAANCISWWLVKNTDTCDIITTANSITLEQFLAWNPDVGNGSNNCTQLVPDYDVCVLVEGLEPGGNQTITSRPPGNSTSPTSSVPPTRTTSTKTSTRPGGSNTPVPVQSGMVQGCKRFYFVEPNDGCWAISNSAKIDLNDFYKWNPAVRTDCTLLQAGYYVCIGLGGPATTITSGPPVPAPT
ncbi:peptidoglycan-binding protein [Niveomyces insectorum RCEF 264]|uniref:Peptidoglycan-binding protein n=1 Tax=Niveomyces insectorum RCEF 264 TaxID=1081102 RepID=A0A167W690_9HYPO|nr:peptidoglycan-binding protein [Niveomyces insectorum RCEF 264]